MKRNGIAFLIVLFLYLLTAGFVSADYLFKVPRAETTVIVEKDGSMTLEYTYEFENLGQSLDFIDMRRNSYRHLK